MPRYTIADVATDQPAMKRYTLADVAMGEGSPSRGIGMPSVVARAAGASSSFLQQPENNIPMASPTIKVLKAGLAADKNYPMENTLPTVGAVGGAALGGAATLPSGAGVPFGATIGAFEGGAAGEVAKNYIKVLRNKPGVPETAGQSLKEAGVEGTKQAATELGGALIVGSLKKVFMDAPRVLMNKVIDVSKKRLQAEALDKTEEIGAKAASEWKNAGKSSSEILGRIKEDMPKIGKAIRDKIDDTFGKTQTKVDTAKYFDDAVTPVIKKLAPNPANQEAIAGIDTLKQKYLKQYGDKMTLPQLEDLKISLYNDISDASWWKANEALPDKVKAHVALARGARKIIDEHVEGISELNAQYGLYASMKAFLAGTEAGGGKSIIKLFVEPAYEKALTAAAVPAQKIFGPAVKVMNPVIPPSVQAAFGVGRAQFPERDRISMPRLRWE